ncbi:TEF transcription factor, PAR bZIP family member a isoform X1 [Tachysurus fulvidraco]|uniref:TEF transcription factor, PAR bZIP family member a isoform X1 n=1 Tax=Tachysurus fulvidraco TaxID=1234273 RepID=UPI000F511F5C|nr:TEF transcription factor, PAR bZIP family member a isoform X1 [Tachysurus fulvidraco]
MSAEKLTVRSEEGGGPPAAFPVALQKILEIPPPNVLECADENEKEKLSGDDVDSRGGVSGLGPSAALTPAIWDKTIPYDGKTFHLEYMDLEEFLMENGISASEQVQQKTVAKESSKQLLEESSPIIPKTEPSPAAPISLLPTLELEQCEEVITSVVSNLDSPQTKTGLNTERERLTPDPVNPEEIEIAVNFEPDPADLVLSSVPGGELFDPRKHRFNEEDLKPQPIIKKAKKMFVPEEQKDERYWHRRKKNNIAAKRSRDARRLKENQITVRAAFLERENLALRQEVAELRKDLGRCKKIVASYESKYGALQ